MQYNPNHPATIKEIFSLEGEGLKKAGFEEPDLSVRPDEYMPTGIEHDRSAQAIGHIGLNPATAEYIYEK